MAMEGPYSYNTIDHSRQGGLEIDPNHEAQSQKQVDDRPDKYQTGQYQTSPTLATPDSYEGKNASDIQDGRRICSLRPVTFWLICVIILLIIAAAVGGGVGGSIAVKNATANANATNAAAASNAVCPRASTSVPIAATTTTNWGPVPTSTAYSGCPGADGTTYQTINGDNSFQIYCNHNLPFTPTSDMQYIMTSTFGLCMEACGSWNAQGKFSGGSNVTCAAVTFYPEWVFGAQTSSSSGIPADCVLKSYGDESKIVVSSLGVHVGRIK